MYSAYFVDASVYLPDKPYSNFLKLFGFFHNGNSIRNEHDPRIKETIFKIILEEFQNENTILVFVCSQEDYHQRCRKILFDKWFKECQYSHNYIKINELLYESQYVSFVFTETNLYKEDLEKSILELGASMEK